MATGIHGYDWPTQTHTMITAHSLNHIMRADVTLKFDLGLLSPRMLTMLINTFKRGYKLREGSGQLNSMINILCKNFDIPRLPSFSIHQGHFYTEKPDFIKWLKGMGLILNIEIKQYNGYTFYSPSKPADLATLKLMFQGVKKKYKKDCLPLIVDHCQKAIVALENKSIIQVHKQYPYYNKYPAK